MGDGVKPVSLGELVVSSRDDVTGLRVCSCCSSSSFGVVGSSGSLKMFGLMLSKDDMFADVPPGVSL